MSDARRRRKIHSNDSGASEDEGSLVAGSGGESEYESADDEDDVVIEEGEEGAGAPTEGEEGKKLDDDEDRKNPQYIPKKGTFYEHDDRMEEAPPGPTGGTDKDHPEEVATPQKELKKKVWKEDNKWGHDKFDEFEQSPKLPEELIAAYGYDIRNEDGPPKAHRRRRYGGGPGKYTRDWQDTEAYERSPRRGGGGRGGRGRGHSTPQLTEQEFPALNSTVVKTSSVSSEAKTELKTNDENSHPTSFRTSQDRDEQPREQVSREWHASSRKPMHPRESGPPQRHDGEGHNQRRSSFGEQDEEGEGGWNKRGGGKGRGASRGKRDLVGRGRSRSTWSDDPPSHRTEDSQAGKVTPSKQPPTASPPQRQAPQTLEYSSDVRNSANQEPSHRPEETHRPRGKKYENRRVIPPRLQEAAAAAGTYDPSNPDNPSRPKRYSSQRQRPPVQPPEQQGSGMSYQQQNPPLVPHTTYFESPMEPAVSNYTPAPMTVVSVTHPQLPMSVGAPPAFVGHPPTYPPAPRMFPPPVVTSVMPPISQPPHLMASPVPQGAPTFLPAEGMINYAPPLGAHPPQFPVVAPFPGFSVPVPVVSAPQEMVFSSNGVTYYNTQSQQQLPRIAVPLQKRPKAAIPIVPPPERELRRGIYHQHGEDDAGQGEPFNLQGDEGQAYCDSAQYVSLEEYVEEESYSDEEENEFDQQVELERVSSQEILDEKLEEEEREEDLNVTLRDESTIDKIEIPEGIAVVSQRDIAGTLSVTEIAVDDSPVNVCVQVGTVAAETPETHISDVGAVSTDKLIGQQEGGIRSNAQFDLESTMDCPIESTIKMESEIKIDTQLDSEIKIDTKIVSVIEVKNNLEIESGNTNDDVPGNLPLIADPKVEVSSMTPEVNIQLSENVYSESADDSGEAAVFVSPPESPSHQRKADK